MSDAERIQELPAEGLETEGAGAAAAPEPRPLPVKVVTLILVLAAWELAGLWVNPLFLSPPSAIARAFVALLRSGELVTQFLTSLQGLLLGVLASVVFGVTLGVFMGRIRMVEYVVEPYVIALYSTPSIALIPLFILWFGVGFVSKVAIVFVLSVFLVVINTFAGVKNVSQSVVDVGHAVLAMIVAEFFTAISGLGGMIVKYANFFDTPKLFVPIIVVSGMGFLLVEAVKYCEARLTPWKETERAQRL